MILLALVLLLLCIYIYIYILVSLLYIYIYIYIYIYNRAPSFKPPTHSSRYRAYPVPDVDINIGHITLASSPSFLFLKHRFNLEIESRSRFCKLSPFRSNSFKLRSNSSLAVHYPALRYTTPAHRCMVLPSQTRTSRVEPWMNEWKNELTELVS